jgi:4-diphosphocytidyl-2-C-methyl-D-erythritol kinase
MAAALAEQAPAKINLTLRVLGRRADGYHTLESLVAFAELADTLTLQPGLAPTLNISGSFGPACGAAADNLVLKALNALRERVAGLKGGHFLLQKNIPVAAGLGGGSSDAAAALRLLALANDLALSDPRLVEAAGATGADVPVCLDPRTRVMRGVGDELSMALDFPPLPTLLVNPGVPLATRDVFAKFIAGHAGQKPLDELPKSPNAAMAFLGLYGNVLTPAAIACQPKIAAVIERLQSVSGVRLVRMSGSGPTCFALFNSAGEAAAAARLLANERSNWWVCPTVLGSLAQRP